MNSPNHILLLVSDPLDAALSIKRDLLALQEVLRELAAAAVFEVFAAEADAVRRHLERGDRARYALLHYLGHGAKPAQASDGVLIFEKTDGTADELDATRLAQTLAGAAAEGKLAVLSACHSEHAAQALFAVGVEHVVAIEGEQMVYEAAAVAFCRGFYGALLTGRKLSEACEAGQRALFTDQIMRQLGDRVTQAEVAKFKLLSRPGCDPASFQLAAGRGEAEWQLLPALTKHPFYQQPEEFLGREQDMIDLLGLLNRKRAAVVLGVSGVGKTELAKQTARRMVERRRVSPAHVGFAPLVNARTADEARVEIVRALGLKPDEIRDDGALQQAVPPHRLVILDEAENVVRDDGLAFRQLLDALISAPTRPFVIVTSQTNPNTSKAPPLQVRRLSEQAALRLFVVNTDLTPEQAARINRQDLLEVMAQVDRLPRAVELIARVWRHERGANQENVDLQPLLRQLRADRDRVMRDPVYPDEVKSVTVGIQYAYDRLCARNPAAARLWTQLALFPGGVSKAGLPAIFGADAAGLCAEIEGQSLVEFPYASFPMPFGDLLELPTPFRHFALRQLPEGGAAAVQQALGDAVLRYYFDFPDEPHRGWVGVLNQVMSQSGAAMGAFIARYDAELPSIESWLDWAYEHESGRDNRSRAARLTALLENLYVVNNTMHEQRHRLNRALACALRCADSAGEANVRKALGDLLLREDDLRGAQWAYQAALPIYQEIEDRLGVANTLRAMGEIEIRLDDWEGAERRFKEALLIYRGINDRLGEANTLRAMGDYKIRKNELQNARLDYEAALLIYRSISDRLGEANCLQNIGDIDLIEEKASDAYNKFNSALEIYQQIGDQLGMGKSYLFLARTIGLLLGSAQAVLLYEEAIRIYRHIGYHWGEALALNEQGTALFEMQDDEAGLAAWRQVWEIFKIIGDSRALALDEVLKMAPELYPPVPHTEAEARRQVGVMTAKAEAILYEGQQLVRNGAWKRGRDHLFIALGIFRDLNNIRGKARNSLALGEVQLLFGDYEMARLSFRDAERFFRQVKDEEGLAITQLKLGSLALHMYDPDEARKRLQFASTYFHSKGDPAKASLSDRLLELSSEYQLGQS